MLFQELCLVLSLLVTCLAQSPQLTPLGPLPQAYDQPESCAVGTEFYQPGNLSCVACELNQQISFDGFSSSCLCPAGFYRSLETGGQCLPCGSGGVTSRDGFYCLECSSSGFNPQTSQCNPCLSNTQIFIDVLPSNQTDLGNRSCVECPHGYWTDSAGFSCVQCGLPDCTQCVSSNGVCFSPDTVLLTPPTGVFQFYAENFAVSVELCRTHSNVTACQLLANLCVLQRYSLSDPACVQSMMLAGSTLPPIYYPPQSADEWLERDDILTTLATTDKTGGVSTLPLAVATFSLNGTFLGLTDVNGEIVLCGERPSRLLSAWRVGVLYQIECTLSVAELTAQYSTPVFYDLFLQDRSVSGSVQVDRLYPIAVLPTDFRNAAGGLVNQITSDPGEWQFVRRFFLAEAVSGSPRYARDVRLFSPTTNQLSARYTTEYIRTTFDFTIGLSVTLSVLAVGVAVYTGFRINGFLRRSGNLCCHVHTFVLTLVEFGAGVSTAIFVLLAVASTFWLIFYKAQVTFFLVLPIGRDELAFKILLGVALLFRVMHMAYLLWHQSTIDIFFIDWERPRGLLLTSSQPMGSTQATPTTTAAPVSIWRTYFVANEWNEIQSVTKINHTLLLSLVLLFGQVVGLEHLAERDPSPHLTTPESRYLAPFSSVLRFSITSLLFTVIAVMLRLFVFLIYERFFEHKIRQFVDLCSVSNISVFIMSRKLYGFYIHGRSVHGHADTNMREMNQNLFKERENMCGHRGLELDSDLQVYEMSLTQEFRNHYEKIFSPISDDSAPVGVATRRGDGRSLSERGVTETTLKAYHGMNQFLSSFIERSLQGVDYIIKDKLLLEKVLKVEFFSTPNMSTFYRDPGFNFDNLLFYGSGWALFQFDVLVFAVVDLLAESYVLSAAITFIVAWMMRILRETLAKRNLGRKTLVDERFLI